MRVFTNGCFDILHAGHVEFLQKAAGYGLLTVGVNDDESVRKLKGPGRPINNEQDRLAVIRALACVNHAFLVRSTNMAASIRIQCPDVWLKGGDYTLETLDKDEVAAAHDVEAQIVILPLKPGYSTTAIVAKLQQA